MITNLVFYLREPRFRSIGVVFAIHAILLGLWVVRLPEVKEQLALSEQGLGFCLFFLPVGAFLAMLSTGYFIRRCGAGLVTMVASVVYALVMMLPILSPSPVWLGAALFVVGIAAGAMDIAMNAVAAALEKLHDRIIMATTHGFFSLGAMVGAFIGSLFLGTEISGWMVMAGGVVGCLVLLPGIHRQIGHIKGEEEAGGHHLALPGKTVLGLAIIGLFTMMGEGAIADWSGVFLQEITLAEGTLIGLGFTGFSLAMTIGRFYGDALITKLGGFRIILFGSILVIIGLAIVVAGETYSAILGFTLIGFGYSSIIPVVFSEAARSDAGSASRGITAVASFGYLGFLVGPVLIGLISEWGGLQTGMGFLLGTAVVTLLISRSSVRKRG